MYHRTSTGLPVDVFFNYKGMLTGSFSLSAISVTMSCITESLRIYMNIMFLIRTYLITH